MPSNPYEETTSLLADEGISTNSTTSFDGRRTVGYSLEDGLGLYHFLGQPYSPRVKFSLRRFRLRRIWGSLVRWVCIIASVLVGLVIGMLFYTIAFQHSYSDLPPHYKILNDRALSSGQIGRANPLNEKIFICVALYDRGGQLADGRWGESVLELIDLLGHDNVFLSIFENNSGAKGAAALHAFKLKVKSKHEIVVEDDTDMNQFPKVTMPDGTQRVRRIPYLSRIRNRSLEPLDKASDMAYDKVLFLNDIYFRPVDAAQLLFSTNMQAHGRTDYLVACAMDFHDDAFHFYDTFALRDAEGYEVGLPYFPVFADVGLAQSRREILGQSDAVRVSSCWGGLTAVDAKYLQKTDTSSEFRRPADITQPTIPVRFRAETSLFYESCECCLLIADLSALASSWISAPQATTTKPSIPLAASTANTGVFLNPYVRVAYDPTTLSWIPFATRLEHMLSPLHALLSRLFSPPPENAYRTIRPGEKFADEASTPEWGISGTETKWGSSGANPSVQRVRKMATATPGLFCREKGLQLLQPAGEKRESGARSWESWVAPEVA